MKKNLFLNAENWPCHGEYDVVVAGAGPGGICAAIAAAKSGVRTLLVDKAGSPGGMSTHALVPHIMGIGHLGKQIVGGIGDEIVRNLASLNYGFFQENRQCSERPIGNHPIHGDIIASDHGLRLIYTKMLDEAGVETLFYSSVLGGLTEDCHIQSISVDCLEGPVVIKGKQFIDATGDAYLLHRLGGQTRIAKIDESMTKTMLMDFGGVDDFNPDAVLEAFNKQKKKKNIPVLIQDNFMGYASFDKGVVHLNYTAVTGNALTSQEMSIMDKKLREQIEEGLKWFRKFIPGFSQAYIVRTPHIVGVRAGRGGVGMETLRQEDIDNDIPVHESIGLGIKRYGDHGITSFNSTWRKNIEGTRPIPWKTLLSTDFYNLALAGRDISCEPKILTCIRYIGQCFVTGQAAGVNAALAVQKNSSLVQVGYTALRDTLLKEGVIL